MASEPTSTQNAERKDDASVEQLEKTPRDVTAEGADTEFLAAHIRPSAEKHLVRILDLRLLPTIILVFILNYIDVSIDVSYLFPSKISHGTRSYSELLYQPHV
jgi:hypothetical protein